jgi:hypothetical protein
MSTYTLKKVLSTIDCPTLHIYIYVPVSGGKWKKPNVFIFQHSWRRCALSKNPKLSINLKQANFFSLPPLCVINVET